MMINSNDPIDLTGLNMRDLRDIEHSMVEEREKLKQFDLDSVSTECMMKAIYRTLIVIKKINKEKYTPKKYKKPLCD